MKNIGATRFSLSQFDLHKLLPKSPIIAPYVLGIDGLSRSGKTTFVSKLEHFFESSGYRTAIYHLDDYVEPRNRRYNTGHEEWVEYYFLQWDLEKVKKELLDQKSDAEIIVIEGVFLQRSEWREAFDQVVYLDCAQEVRFQRESAATQQNVKKFEDRYWKAERYYLERVRPVKMADYVIET